jgi:hypothetical protein
MRTILLLMLNQINKSLLIILVLLIAGCSLDSSGPTDSTSNNFTPHTPTPVDGANNQLLFVTLRWESDNVSEYEVYIGETNPPLIKYTSTQNKFYTTPPLNYDTKYYWRVVAKGNDGTIYSSPVWSFRTISTIISINGYALKLFTIETKLPNTVEAIFQVMDLNGSGVPNLRLADFEVFEDELPLSISESGLTIVNRATTPYKFKTVLMLDNSTSLENDLNTIRTSAKEIVAGIKPNQQVALYKFSDKPELLQDYTENINLLKNIIDTQFNLGVRSTDFYGSVKVGTKRWDDVVSIDSIIQGCLILISDGEDTQGSTSLSEGFNSIHNKLVFTLGLGPAIQPEIIRAFGTGGNFKPGQEIEIIKRFAEIEAELIKKANSFYKITYNSPKRGNSNHVLKVRIKNNPFFGSESFISAVFSSTGFF